MIEISVVVGPRDFDGVSIPDWMQRRTLLPITNDSATAQSPRPICPAMIYMYIFKYMNK